MTALSSGESFRDYARRILADTSDPDPGTAVDKILGELSDKECRVALAFTLRDYLRHIVPAPEPGPEVTTPARVPRVSATTERIRAYAALLRESYFNGAEWKYYGTCTAADLQAGVAGRRKMAADTLAGCDRDDAVADYMTKKRLKTVADIPESVLLSIKKGKP